MKKAAKVFIWIGIAFTILSAINTFTQDNPAMDEIVATLGKEFVLIVNVVSTVISIGLSLTFGLIALKQMKMRKPSTGICICVLLFCNIIAGILLMCSKPEEYNQFNFTPTKQDQDQNPTDNWYNG